MEVCNTGTFFRKFFYLLQLPTAYTHKCVNLAEPEGHMLLVLHQGCCMIAPQAPPCYGGGIGGFSPPFLPLLKVASKREGTGA